MSIERRIVSRGEFPENEGGSDVSYVGGMAGRLF